MKHKNMRLVAQTRTKPSVRETRPKTTPSGKQPRVTSSREKVRSHRERMRAKGYRLVQMWLPDTRTPEFPAEAHRQSLRANTSPFAAEDQAWVDSTSEWNSD